MEEAAHDDGDDDDDDDAVSRLADDYMWGFDSNNEEERRDLGLVLARGRGADEDIRHFTTHSLLRGVEEWDQMISCATAMREKEAATPGGGGGGGDDDPLAGRDLLTFLSRLVLPHAVAQWKADREDVEDVVTIMSRSRNHAIPPPRQPPPPSSSSSSSRKPTKGIKRKRRQAEDKGSPYWTTTASQSQPQSQPQSQLQPLSGPELAQQTNCGDEQELTKKQRKQLKKRLRKPAKGQILAALDDTYPVPFAGEEAPVLQEASLWYGSEDDIAAPKFFQEDLPVSDGRSSVNGGGGVSLKDNHS